MERECKEMKGGPKQGLKKTRRGRERRGGKKLNIKQYGAE